MRLIDADAADVERISCSYSDHCTLDDVKEWLNEQPTIKAEPVVRCRECKWFNHPGCAIFIVDDSDRPTENDFCSFGERREDNDQI